MKRERVVIGHELDRLYGLGAVGSMTDSQLIAVFLEGDDQSGALAFEAIVERHGPMVLQTCRIVLRDFHAAEDAFQATFLVLARKAQTLGSRELLGHWLRGVAIRTAKKAKVLTAKQRSREYECALAQVDAVEGSCGEGLDEDIYRILHEEIDRLPRSYRTAISACYLEGKSQSQAAVQLRLSESTIRGRLARARKLLDRRLTLREVSPTYALFTVGAVIARGGTMPRDMVRPTARAALDFLNQGQASSCAVSLRIRALANGELFTMSLYQLKAVAAVILALGTLATAGVLVAQPTARAQPQRTVGASPSPNEILPEELGRVALTDSTPTNAAPAQESEAEAEKAGDVKVDPELEKLAPGSVVRAAPVSKDCMILAYLPEWAHGDVDNIGLGNNDGGNRALLEWPAIPAKEAASPDHRFVIALYSRETISHPPTGRIHAYEIKEEWRERTSWTNRPSYEPDSVATYKFEPGKGWKLFDITDLVRAQAKAKRKGHGVMLRFESEDLSGPNHSDYKCVSREATGEWEARRPVLLVVKVEKE
jgi:RNA polymerase sigma factor (sigma-70 family)